MKSVTVMMIAIKHWHFEYMANLNYSSQYCMLIKIIKKLVCRIHWKIRFIICSRFLNPFTESLCGNHLDGKRCAVEMDSVVDPVSRHVACGFTVANEYRVSSVDEGGSTRSDNNVFALQFLFLWPNLTWHSVSNMQTMCHFNFLHCVKQCAINFML